MGRMIIILALVLNLISAALFIGLVNRPVYDDPYNIFDVHNYATTKLLTKADLDPHVFEGETGNSVGHFCHTVR